VTDTASGAEPRRGLSRPVPGPGKYGHFANLGPTVARPTRRAGGATIRTAVQTIIGNCPSRRGASRRCCRHGDVLTFSTSSATTSHGAVRRPRVRGRSTAASPRLRRGARRRCSRTSLGYGDLKRAISSNVATGEPPARRVIDSMKNCRAPLQPAGPHRLPHLLRVVDQRMHTPRRRWTSRRFWQATRPPKHARTHSVTRHPSRGQHHRHFMGATKDTSTRTRGPQVLRDGPVHRSSRRTGCRTPRSAVALR